MGAYHVTAYVEVVPTATAQTAALMKAYRDVARKEPGATMVEVYQEIGMPSRFVTREVWRDAQAADAHTVHFETPNARGVAAGSVVIVSHLDVTPNGLPQLIDLMKGLGEGTAKEQGVATYQILRQTGGARNHFRLLEIWANEKAWEAHNLAKHTQDFRDGLAPLLGTPYDQRKYTLVN
jgi:quinol monooxygenase YgiN